MVGEIPDAVAVVPPEYFPGAPLASLLCRCSRVFVADGVQYSRQSLQNRCRIRTPDGALWLSIPLLRGQSTAPIRAVTLSEDQAWRVRHRKSLAFNYRSSPYYEFYAAQLDNVLEKPTTGLADITVASMRLMAEMLETPVEIVRLSHRIPDAGSELHSISWIASLDAAQKASGQKGGVIDGRDWSAHAVELFDRLVYRQVFPGFVSGLSALDLILNRGPIARELLDEIGRNVRLRA